MKLINTIALLAVPFALLLGGCDKKSEGASGGATKSAESSAGSADGAKLEAAYQSTFGDMKRKDGFAEKFKDFKAKTGEPQKKEGKNMFWWGWNAKSKSCREIKIIDGAGGMMKTVDKGKCGK